MKILVTGGLGFIGSHTAVELQNEGHEVVIVDNLSNSSKDVLDGITAITGKTPIFEEFDLREKAKVQDFFKKQYNAPKYPRNVIKYLYCRHANKLLQYIYIYSKVSSLVIEAEPAR